MKILSSRVAVAAAFALIAIIMSCSKSWALDTVVLKNGKVIQGAIIRMDSLAIIIAPWEDRNALYPRGDVYTKDEIQAITFDTNVSVSLLTLLQNNRLNIQTGVWELSMSTSFQSVNPDEGENYSCLNIPIRAGYFVARNISLEVEMMITQPETGDMGYLISASGLIHPKIKALNSHPWIRPFLLMGWGFGTGVPLGDSVPSDTDNPLNLFQTGLGLKVGEGRVGLRIEYRISSLFGRQDIFREGTNEEGNYYAYRVEQNRTDVFQSLLIGFSVFLGR
jgi:hypothetical protein